MASITKIRSGLASINFPTDSPFDAVRENSSVQKVLKEINSSNIDTKENGQSLVSYSIACNRLDVASELVEKGARLDIDSEVFDPLRLLMSLEENFHNGTIGLIIKMVAKCPNLVNKPYREENGWTVLGLIAAHADEAVVKNVLPFLSKSTEIDNITLDDENLWQVLAERKMFDFIYSELERLPIEERKKVINAKTHPCSLLSTAASKGDLNFARWLIENGAEVNLSDDVWNFPLYSAADNGHKDMVELLIKMGAKVNHVSINKNYNTPDDSALYIAVLGGHVECVRLLLEHGADVHMANGFQETTALEYMKGMSLAEKGVKFQQITHLLKQASIKGLLNKHQGRR